VEENQFWLPKDRTNGAKDHQSQIDVLCRYLGWQKNAEEAQCNADNKRQFFFFTQRIKEIKSDVGTISEISTPCPF
jgi:hypothetical protein